VGGRREEGHGHCHCDYLGRYLKCFESICSSVYTNHEPHCVGMNVVWRAVESAYHPHFGIWGGGVGAQRVHERCEHLRRFLLILEMHTFVSIADSATHRLDAVAKIFPRSAVRTVRALTSTADAFFTYCIDSRTYGALCCFRPQSNRA
jgi:hypothetical protein